MPHYTTDRIPTMTSNTAPSGVASASSEFNSSYAAWRAMNDEAGRPWGAAPLPSWLQYQFPSAHTVTRYTITTASEGYQDYEPKSWSLEGSNDGAEWVTLDEQADVVDWHMQVSVTKTFDVADPDPYTHYRLVFTASNGSNGLVVDEFELMERPDLAADVTVRLGGPAFLELPSDDSRYCMAANVVLTVGGSAYPSGSIVAACVIRVAGEDDTAWLGEATADAQLLADSGVHIRCHAYLTIGTPSVDATDGLGWTAPDAPPSDLAGLVVKLGGRRVRLALISGLTVELSDRGGPESATMTMFKDVRTQLTPMLTTLLITYKSTVLFKGRLEAIDASLADDMGVTLTFTGPIVKLRDHRAFRRVYVTSDPDEWQTDQGPNTSANVFSVEAS